MCVLRKSPIRPDCIVWLPIGSFYGRHLCLEFRGTFTAIIFGVWVAQRESISDVSDGWRLDGTAGRERRNLYPAVFASDESSSYEDEIWRSSDDESWDVWSGHQTFMWGKSSELKSAWRNNQFCLLPSMFNGGYRFVGMCSLFIALIGVHIYTIFDDEEEIPGTPPMWETDDY